MSRYTLLLLLNLPFIIAAILSAITQYKLGKTTRKKLWMQIILWISVLIGLFVTRPLYEWLFSHQLTETEPLSLFDVVQITAIVIVFYIANRSRSRVEQLEKRMRDLHQELSIILSEDAKNEK